MPNDAVLVDIGAFVEGYAADMTRMFFFGKPDPRLAAIYEVVRDAQNKAIKGTKPGVTSSKLYDISKKAIEKAGYGEHYLHSLGHGIGLEVHEYPILRADPHPCTLAPGMCVTIEPGIYLPGIGGVRIEDMVLVTKDGHRELSGCPKAQVILPVV
jgi:Xaa-Pro aminopeptidase